jgi:hypothetical protein
MAGSRIEIGRWPNMISKRLTTCHIIRDNDKLTAVLLQANVFASARVQCNGYNKKHHAENSCNYTQGTMLTSANESLQAMAAAESVFETEYPHYRLLSYIYWNYF